MLDLVIVGGGLVGASLALALADSGLSIGLVEARALDASGHPAFDDRAIALSQGSLRIFERLGLWQELAPSAAPIRHIHVSDRGHFGVTRLSASGQGVPALGQVALARDLGRVMAARLKAQTNLRLFCPARLLDFRQEADAVALSIDHEGGHKAIHCQLLVAADGKDSPIRTKLCIGTHYWDYDQSAVTAVVRMSKSHEDRAFERFTDSGPLALLPLPDGRMALVWTAWNQKKGLGNEGGPDVKTLMAMDGERFAQALQARFGWRLGRILEVGPRFAYPLSYMQAKSLTSSRIALVGNAAHLLHPIAGQGFNLGLRDVDLLARLLNEAAAQGADIGDAKLLGRYASGRLRDQKATGFFTDGLVRLFSNNLPCLGLLRGLGLAALDCLPPLRRHLGQRAMGLMSSGWLRS